MWDVNVNCCVCYDAIEPGGEKIWMYEMNASSCHVHAKAEHNSSKIKAELEKAKVLAILS